MEAPWVTEHGLTKGECSVHQGDWLFGPAKEEWNRDAYFIKMYKVKNCLEKKIVFLLSRPLSVELPSNLLHNLFLTPFTRAKGSLSPRFYIQC